MTTAISRGPASHGRFFRLVPAAGYDEPNGGCCTGSGANPQPLPANEPNASHPGPASASPWRTAALLK